MTTDDGPARPEQSTRGRTAAILATVLAVLAIATYVVVDQRQEDRAAVTVATTPASTPPTGSAMTPPAGSAMTTASGGTPTTAASYLAKLNHDDLTLAFDLPAFDGGRVTSDSLRGKPVIISFFASWCPQCDFEMPDFQALHTELGDKITVIGVNPQEFDNDAKALALVAKHHVTYRTARDPKGDLLRIFNGSGSLPTTVFLDANGTVVRREIGIQVRRLLTPELKESYGITWPAK
jgi:thiol-disulfide isomerase/thioredoxin